MPVLQTGFDPERRGLLRLLLLRHRSLSTDPRGWFLLLIGSDFLTHLSRAGTSPAKPRLFWVAGFRFKITEFHRPKGDVQESSYD